MTTTREPPPAERALADELAAARQEVSRLRSERARITAHAALLRHGLVAVLNACDPWDNPVTVGGLREACDRAREILDGKAPE